MKSYYRVFSATEMIWKSEIFSGYFINIQGFAEEIFRLHPLANRIIVTIKGAHHNFKRSK
jgi:hypothetical protein